MCGIIGYLGERPAGAIIHAGLGNLEYRGYDSAGIALTNDSLTVSKSVGEVTELAVPDVAHATCGIGHTRWSTHGAPTTANAHPHLDCTERIAVVHNGIIENYTDLREELADHTFVSDTDTEVIPHLIEEAWDEGVSLTDAVQVAAERLVGSYAFCVTSPAERGIVAVRNGSPLVIGHAEDGGFVASDVPAFLEYTREVTYLEDGETVVISDHGIEVSRDGEAVPVDIERVTWDAEAAEKGGYAHYMRKEIHEQPDALRQAIAERIDLDGGAVDLGPEFPTGYLDSLEEIQLVAAGTSYYAALYGAHLLEELSAVRTNVTSASEFTFGAGRDPWRTLAIAVTQSGETKDTLDAIRTADAAGARTLAVTNVLGSSVTRATDDSVFIRAGPEIGVASTKAFSSQVVSLLLLAIAIARERGTLARTAARNILADLNRLPGAVQQVLDREADVAETAEQFLEAGAYFFIGRRLGYPVALEGALKLKEISYAHAEGFAAGDLKHGPLALVTADTPVIAVLTDGAHPTATLHNLAEAQTRGAPGIGIVSSDVDADTLDVSFAVDSVGLVEPLVANVYLQLFAYHTANHLGRPIDKPRNLAKSVTVD